MLPLRRSMDLLLELELFEVQLQIMHEEAGPHIMRNLGVRIAAAHRRMDEIEQELRRRAFQLGLVDAASGPLNPRKLTQLRDRRHGEDPRYQGPERRKAPRRLIDQPRAEPVTSAPYT
jgi:hypothetical protein